MIKNLAEAAQPFLNNPIVRRTRRNHGLEHATVHILTNKTKSRPLAGRSDAGGFWLLGNLDTPLVEEAVAEALRRLQAGEHNLAVHPGCGTARLTTGAMVGIAALAGTVGVKRNVAGYLSRLPAVMVLAMGAMVISEPVGLQIQEHFTTLGDPGDLRVIAVERKGTTGLGGSMAIHRISTTSS